VSEKKPVGYVGENFKIWAFGTGWWSRHVHAVQSAQWFRPEVEVRKNVRSISQSEEGK